MKRLAILVLLAAVGPVSAADLPVPTGMARTEPSVPAPVLMGGVPIDGRVSFRDRLGIGVVDAMPAEAVPAGPRLWNRMLSWRPCQDCALFQAPTWCETCAPVVKRPLPPLPAGISTGNCATGACAAPAQASGSCCEKLKAWACFHYTPVRIPLTPTPKEPALYTYFPTRERAPLSVGGDCATGHCGKLRSGGATGACVPCPAPGEALVPGYRLANP